MKFTFNENEVERLITHTVKSEKYGRLYGEYTGAGLWLVSGEGVYLESNSMDPVPLESDIEKLFERLDKGEISNEQAYEIILKDHPYKGYAFAKECNPGIHDFHRWWKNKRKIFGGEDGVEFIPLDELNPDGWVEIDVTPENYTLTTHPKEGERKLLEDDNWKRLVSGELCLVESSECLKKVYSWSQDWAWDNEPDEYPESFSYSLFTE